MGITILAALVCFGIVAVIVIIAAVVYFLNRN